MTNKEKYKKAFSVLQTSQNFSSEVEKMAILKRKQKMNLAVAAAVVCVIVGGSATAYGADVGGIQEKLSAWIHGSKVDVDVTDDGDGYLFTYDENGTEITQGGGGVIMDADGNERPLSAKELLDNMSEHPDIDTDDSGNVWVYYYDQAIDITELLDEAGSCRIALTHEDTTIYVEITVEEDGSYSSHFSNDLPEGQQALYTPVN